MELVDVADSKSAAGDSVPVRVRSPAQIFDTNFDTTGIMIGVQFFYEFMRKFNNKNYSNGETV